MSEDADEVQSRDAALAQRGDERLDEPPAPALTLQLGQQVDVQVRGVLRAVRLGAAAARVRVDQGAVLPRPLDLGLRPPRSALGPPLVVEPVLERVRVGRADDVADHAAVVGLDDEGEIGMPMHVGQHEDLGPDRVVVEDSGRVGSGIRCLEADVRDGGLVAGAEGADAGHPTSLGLRRPDALALAAAG